MRLILAQYSGGIVHLNLPVAYLFTVDKIWMNSYQPVWSILLIEYHMFAQSEITDLKISKKNG